MIEFFVISEVVLTGIAVIILIVFETPLSRVVDIEYREVKPYWTVRLSSTMNWLNRGFTRRCFLQLGYKPETRLEATITQIEIVNGKDTDLHIDKPVYAIYLSDIEEV